MIKISEKEEVSKFEGWIVGMLTAIEAEKVEEMIEIDEVPLLFDYELPSFLLGIKSVIKKHKEEVLEGITMDSVLSYAKQYRPDLGRVINTEEGYLWMSRFLKVIRFTIENIELNRNEVRQKFYAQIAAKRNEKLKRAVPPPPLSPPVILKPPPSPALEVPPIKTITVPAEKKKKSKKVDDFDLPPPVQLD